jgi:predicted nucleic acid-binding Zn ribbon protein
MHPDPDEMSNAFHGPTSKPNRKKYKDEDEDEDADADDQDSVMQEDLTEDEVPVCPTCNGSGKNARGKMCLACSGTGDYIEDDIPSDGKKVKKGNKKPEPEPEEEDEDANEEHTEDNDSESEEEEPSDEENEKEDDSSEEDDQGDEITDCPHHPDSFGEVDEHDECEADGGCPLWDACSDEAEKRKKAAKMKAKDSGKKPMASSDKTKKLKKK